MPRSKKPTRGEQLMAVAREVMYQERAAARKRYGSNKYRLRSTKAFKRDLRRGYNKYRKKRYYAKKVYFKKFPPGLRKYAQSFFFRK